jgi:hypothetical protein
MKYRQHGYQDRNEEPRQKSAPSSAPRKDRANTFGPRPLQMAATHSVSRCSQCGTLLQGLTESIERCTKCNFELHSCKQCTHFDPSHRFECMEKVLERVMRKDARNECTFYSIRISLEKQTSSSGPTRVNDARQAFENLFKK